MTLEDRVGVATKYFSNTQRCDEKIMASAKDVMSQYFNHTDPTATPPETACVPLSISEVMSSAESECVCVCVCVQRASACVCVCAES